MVRARNGTILLLLAVLLPQAAHSASKSRSRKQLVCGSRDWEKLSAEEAGKRKKADLDGSDCSMLYQNLEAERLGYFRVKDKDDLDAMKESGRLVAFPEEGRLRYHPNFPPERRWALPHAERFVAELLAPAFYERFGKPLPLNSAVRPPEFQAGLKTGKSKEARNRNAAPTSGPLASSHLRGITVDIGKYRYPPGLTGPLSVKALARAREELSDRELEWLRGTLLFFEACGILEATEEAYQAVFHVAVFYGLERADACFFSPVS